MPALFRTLYDGRKESLTSCCSHRDEITFDTEHRAFRQSRTRDMEQLASGNLIAVTRNARLENAPVDGVEHTRAAFEAIKKRFHDDLHHRMEIFFTTRHA